mmetsp:Transcript_12246/g.34789  ORF Transcript_12246/g.34789 Transcript_12246/m.34789 type:complete len:87 (+) Transcript_12246:92-352(+)
MGSKVASKEHFKIRTSGRKRGGRVSCAEEMGSFFSCLSKATGNANVTTVCASEIANLRNCAASVAKQPKTVNTINYHLQRIGRLMR